MGLTGKYDFKGIKMYGAKGLMMVLGTTGFGAAILKIPLVGLFIDGAFQLLANWLANKGLVILNIGASIVEGKFDQRTFDSAMEGALAAVEAQHGKVLTPAQQKAIDDEVIKALRAFAPVTR